MNIGKPLEVDTPELIPVREQPEPERELVPVGPPERERELEAA